MLSMDNIEPAQPKRASAIVFVPKEVENLLFCVDSQNVNDVSTWDWCLILGMNECIVWLGATMTFSRLDTSSGK